MKTAQAFTKYRRIVKSALIGLLIATAILCAFFTPAAIKNQMESAAAAIREENLILSQGVAEDSFLMADVAITVLLDGKPHEGMSIAADTSFWTVPQDGEIHLSLAPNAYTFRAGIQNRRISYTAEVFEDRQNELVLDVGKAPDAPDMRTWEIAKGESVVLPIEVSNADSVTAHYLPDGISVTKQNGAYSLDIDGDKLSGGFWCLRLTAENEYGDALMFAVLRIIDNKEAIPISTAEDLSNIRNNLSGHYLLQNDIDMSRINDWVAIGTENYPFTGIFDGGGYEITGFHAPAQLPDTELFGLFGIAKNAQLKNIVFRQANITPVTPTKDIGNAFFSGVLVARAWDSSIENCASIGGIISPTDGYIGGLAYDVWNSLVLDCFNSSDVICNTPNRYLPNTGGIVGAANYSYISRCANEGEVKGTHLTGGIVGFGGDHVTRCINSGYIWGSTIVGAVPVGGIIQSGGRQVSDCYFVRGLSPMGGHSGEFVAAMIAIPESALRSPERLTLLGIFEGETPEWTYVSDARGPVPYSIKISKGGGK